MRQFSNIISFLLHLIFICSLPQKKNVFMYHVPKTYSTGTWGLWRDEKTRTDEEIKKNKSLVCCSLRLPFIFFLVLDGHIKQTNHQFVVAIECVEIFYLTGIRFFFFGFSFLLVFFLMPLGWAYAAQRKSRCRTSYRIILTAYITILSTMWTRSMNRWTKKKLFSKFKLTSNRIKGLLLNLHLQWCACARAAVPVRLRYTLQKTDTNEIYFPLFS